MFLVLYCSVKWFSRRLAFWLFTQFLFMFWILWRLFTLKRFLFFFHFFLRLGLYLKVNLRSLSNAIVQLNDFLLMVRRIWLLYSHRKLLFFFHLFLLKTDFMLGLHLLTFFQFFLFNLRQLILYGFFLLCSFRWFWVVFKHGLLVFFFLRCILILLLSWALITFRFYLHILFHNMLGRWVLRLNIDFNRKLQRLFFFL